MSEDCFAWLILSDAAATRPLLRANTELERPLQSLLILRVTMESSCLQNTDTYKCNKQGSEPSFTM